VLPIEYRAGIDLAGKKPPEYESAITNTGLIAFDGAE
jgi:hypothetical protein